jgi:hypothetical protein
MEYLNLTTMPTESLRLSVWDTYHKLLISSSYLDSAVLKHVNR